MISCYGCHKFLPVSDPQIHKDVVDGLRPIVLEFAEMARPGETSPAMRQLQATLEFAQSVIDQLEGMVS